MTISEQFKVAMLAYFKEHKDQLFQEFSGSWMPADRKRARRAAFEYCETLPDCPFKKQKTMMDNFANWEKRLSDFLEEGKKQVLANKELLLSQKDFFWTLWVTKKLMLSFQWVMLEP